MIGGGDAAATAAWNSRQVPNGTATVKAVITFRDGSTEESTTVFEVAN